MRTACLIQAIPDANILQRPRGVAGTWSAVVDARCGASSRLLRADDGGAYAGGARGLKTASQLALTASQQETEVTAPRVGKPRDGRRNCHLEIGIARVCNIARRCAVAVTGGGDTPLLWGTSRGPRHQVALIPGLNDVVSAWVDGLTPAQSVVHRLKNECHAGRATRGEPIRARSAVPERHVCKREDLIHGDVPVAGAVADALCGAGRRHGR